MGDAILRNQICDVGNLLETPEGLHDLCRLTEDEFHVTEFSISTGWKYNRVEIFEDYKIFYYDTHIDNVQIKIIIEDQDLELLGAEEEASFPCLIDITCCRISNHDEDAEDVEGHLGC